MYLMPHFFFYAKKNYFNLVTEKQKWNFSPPYKGPLCPIESGKMAAMPNIKKELFKSI